jgi:hypothetical protein
MEQRTRKKMLPQNLSFNVRLWRKKRQDKRRDYRASSLAKLVALFLLFPAH